MKSLKQKIIAALTVIVYVGACVSNVAYAEEISLGIIENSNTNAKSEKSADEISVPVMTEKTSEINIVTYFDAEKWKDINAELNKQIIGSINDNYNMVSHDIYNPTNETHTQLIKSNGDGIGSGVAVTTKPIEDNVTFTAENNLSGFSGGGYLGENEIVLFPNEDG